MTSNENGENNKDTWIHIAELTAKIVAAYVANNTIQEEKLPGLINRIGEALGPPRQPRRKRPSEMRAEELAAVKEAAIVPKATQAPKVDKNKAITHQYIWCLECGKAYKNLAIHVRKLHGMSIADYIWRWDLPDDYPFLSEAFKEEEVKRKAQEAQELNRISEELQKRITALEERQSTYSTQGDEHLRDDH